MHAVCFTQILLSKIVKNPLKKQIYGRYRLRQYVTTHSISKVCSINIKSNNGITITLPVRGLGSLGLLHVVIVVHSVAAVVVLPVLHLDVILKLLPVVLAGGDLHETGKCNRGGKETRKGE